MANILSQTIEQISKEKGIEPEVIQRALEEAMVAAAKKYFKTGEELQARFDPETGTIDVFAVKEIVETVTDIDTQMSLEEALSIDDSFQTGEFVEIPKPTAELGRIAAQTAKQVILQKVREAEREIVFDEFSGQVGQLINGIVRRFEGRDIILDTGKTEALLPASEQSRNEQYKQSDRVRAVIVKVHKLSKGPQIVVSRTDPSLLVRLFEMEIPEVYDGTVRVRGAVREGGERAKVAVASRDDAVDPVGACVGMKGSRINAVIRELKGEKIDIIEYSDDIVEYTMNALNPAKISKVLLADPGTRLLEVIVPEDQLSLAIGKKGQNVRLASKLLGWQIDIKSEEEKKREVLSQMENLEPGEEELPLESLNGIGEKTISRLRAAEIYSVQALAASDTDALIAIQGIGEKTAEKLIHQAQVLLSGGELPQEGDAREALAEAGEVAPAGIGEQVPANPEDEAPEE
jgi:transcription termination/antitermination protein NusA